MENQSDFYLNKKQKTKPWPALGRGFNTGVMLYHLEKMRAVQWDRLWTDVAKRTAIIYGATRLGDQDIINAVLKQNPHLVYTVPCQWNTQLSDHTNSYKCYLNHEIKVEMFFRIAFFVLINLLNRLYIGTHQRNIM